MEVIYRKLSVTLLEAIVCLEFTLLHPFAYFSAALGSLFYLNLNRCQLSDDGCEKFSSK